MLSYGRRTYPMSGKDILNHLSEYISFWLPCCAPLWPIPISVIWVFLFCVNVARTKGVFVWSIGVNMFSLAISHEAAKIEPMLCR